MDKAGQAHASIFALIMGFQFFNICRETANAFSQQSDGKLIKSRQLEDLTSITERCTHNHSFVPKLLVIVVHGNGRLNPWIIYGSTFLYSVMFFIPCEVKEKITIVYKRREIAARERRGREKEILKN
jgi:hypothetical protein